MKRAGLVGASAFILLGVSGCPVTDDYFIDAAHPLSGSGGSDTLSQGGEAQAGMTGAKAGSMPPPPKPPPPPGPGNPTGGAADPGVGVAGDTGTGGAPCVPTTERCNGHDDNCNDLTDENACSSTLGCSGFTLSTNLNHGYMFCSSHKTWMQARDACAAQDMRLAALESAAENAEIGKTLEALTTDTDVTIGANDQASEGKWVWDGGTQFWQGNESGKVVNGSFEAWASASPDDYQNNEDCAVMSPTSADWADRNCAGIHAYLCEDKTP